MSTGDAVSSMWRRYGPPTNWPDAAADGLLDAVSLNPVNRYTAEQPSGLNLCPERFPLRGG